MGRTFPSFTYALEAEEAEWKPYRKYLDKADRKKFDLMFDVPRLHISACMYCANPITLHPIIMSVVFHHEKRLNQILDYAEQLTGKRYPDMTLQPNNDTVTRIIASWDGYEVVLSTEDRREHRRMMYKLYKYSRSIEVMASPFENEPAFMSLMFDHDKIINWLLARYSELAEKERIFNTIITKYPELVEQERKRNKAQS